MELGKYLTVLRKVYGLSDTAWAERSGLSRVSLWRWQKGETVPRDREMTVALGVLGVTLAERKQAFYLLAQARDEQGIRRITPLAEVALIRHDLLRALRLRRSMTQQQVSDQCAVPQSSLARWEGGTHWPDIQTLHRLTQFYGALPEEIVALTTLHDKDMGERPDPLAGTELSDYTGDFRLLSLYYLTELGRIQCHQHTDSVKRTAQLRLNYVDHLAYEGRYGDAQDELDRVKTSGLLSTDRDLLGHYFLSLAVMASRMDSLPLQKQWIAKLKRASGATLSMKPEWQRNIQYFTAYFLNHTGDSESAMRFCNELVTGAQKHDDIVALSGAGFLHAELLCGRGDYNGAFKAIEKMECGTPLKDIFVHHARAKIFTAADCRQEAIKAYGDMENQAKKISVHIYQKKAAEKIAALENR